MTLFKGLRIQMQDKFEHYICETEQEISNNVVCATSKASDQPVHTHMIRAFDCRLIIL